MTPDDEFFADPFGGKGLLVHEDPSMRAWIWEDENRRIHICHVERVDPILEANRTLLNESEGKRWGEGQIVASIPNSIFWHGDFAKARENRDQAWLKRFLNDKDNEKLRTFKGRL